MVQNKSENPKPQGEFSSKIPIPYIAGVLFDLNPENSKNSILKYYTNKGQEVISYVGSSLRENTLEALWNIHHEKNNISEDEKTIKYQHIQQEIDSQLALIADEPQRSILKTLISEFEEIAKSYSIFSNASNKKIKELWGQQSNLRGQKTTKNVTIQKPPITTNQRPFVIWEVPVTQDKDTIASMQLNIYEQRQDTTERDLYAINQASTYWSQIDNNVKNIQIRTVEDLQKILMQEVRPEYIDETLVYYTRELTRNLQNAEGTPEYNNIIQQRLEEDIYKKNILYSALKELFRHHYSDKAKVLLCQMNE